MTRTRSGLRQPTDTPDHEPAPERTRTGGQEAHAMRRTRSKSSQAGATVLEYAILLAVLAGVAVAAVGVLGTSLDGMITTIANKIPGLTTGIGTPSS